MTGFPEGFSHTELEEDQPHIRIDLPERHPKARSILTEAESLVNGDRQQAYGTPRDNWRRIRDLARATGRPGLAQITCEDLAVLMVLVKVARETASPKRDNAVDGAAYFHILDQVRGD